MLTFVDLFCGGGFGARGAVQAGATPLLAVDSWEVATDTYHANFPDADILAKPIEKIDPVPLSHKYNPDILLASPECTSHSIARGAKPGCEKSRETAISIMPWIKAFMPRWIVIENVNRMKQWDRHQELISEIENLGFKVNDLFLNAADFGSCQSRKRMFLVCDLEQTNITKEHIMTKYGAASKPASLIIDKTGRYKSNPLYTKRRARPTLERAERAIKALGKGTPFLIVYYGSDYAGGWQSLDSPLRTITTLDRFGLVTWKKNTPYLRMLQPEELIKAMSNCSDHILPLGTRREKIKLCGNGVCSVVVKAIFDEIFLNSTTKTIPLNSDQWACQNQILS